MSEQEDIQQKLKEIREREKAMNIKVSVDDEAYKRLLEEKQKLEEEKKDLEEKLRLVAEKELERRINHIQSVYGVQFTPEQIDAIYENPASISILEQTLKQQFEAQKRQSKIPSGVTPLSREQGYIVSQKDIPLEKREYYDYQSMISDIRAENRQDLINALFEKTLNAIRRGEKTVIYEEPKTAPSLSEQLDYQYFWENIAPKLRRAGMSEEEIAERYEMRKKKKPKDNLSFKIEPIEKK